MEDRPQENRRALAASLSWTFLWLVLVFGGHTVVAQPAVAQHTTVEKNGLAGTIETDHNAAGKATEMRTIGVDGKLQQRVVYDYLPGYYIPGQTDTTYWPSGQVRKVVRKTYDESANFTGEFIKIFDESGKQIEGHKLTHDPWKGTYRCAEWNASAQNYQNIECPSGEEEGGSPTAPKKFTYDEVMKQLDAARKNTRSHCDGRAAYLFIEARGSDHFARAALSGRAGIRYGSRESGSICRNAGCHNRPGGRAVRGRRRRITVVRVDVRITR